MEQVSTGAKMVINNGSKLSEEQANKLIQERREKDGLTWEEIAKELAQKGYRNKKRAPLPAMTVRYRYYRMQTLGTTDLKSAKREATEAERQIALIQKVLGLEADEKSKLKIIESIFGDA
jgi:cyanate lyase